MNVVKEIGTCVCVYVVMVAANCIASTLYNKYVEKKK